MREEAQRTTETLKQQNAALAKQLQHEAEASAYKREKWLVPLLSAAVPVVGGLGIWLGPRIQEKLKRFLEGLQRPSLSAKEEAKLIEEGVVTILKDLPQEFNARILAGAAQAAMPTDAKRSSKANETVTGTAVPSTPAISSSEKSPTATLPANPGPPQTQFVAVTPELLVSEAPASLPNVDKPALAPGPSQPPPAISASPVAVPPLRPRIVQALLRGDPAFPFVHLR